MGRTRVFMCGTGALLLAAALYLGAAPAPRAAAERSAAPPARTESGDSPAAPTVASLDPIIDPSTADAPRDFGCARCEETPSTDPLLVDLAPVDVILLDAVTGAPVPDVELLATDLNGVTQELRSDNAGRIVSDALLRAGPVNVNFAGPPYLKARPLEDVLDPIPAQHCLDWNEPDRWRIPVPVLIPVSLAGPVDAAAVLDLFPYTTRDVQITAGNEPPGMTLSPGSTFTQIKVTVEPEVAELVPVSSCIKSLRDRLDPRASHVAALRPRRNGLESMGLVDPKTGKLRMIERHTYSPPPAPPLQLGLWLDEGDSEVIAGSVPLPGKIRIAGPPLLLDPVKVSRERLDRRKQLDELLGRGVGQHLKEAALRRRGALAKAGY